MRPNSDIREIAKAKGVYLWEIADHLGMFDSNFSKLLRKELPESKKKEIYRAINDLARKEA